MANPAPTINQINAFNATQGTTIDFNIIGGTELVRSNRIYIYDLSDNSLICTHLYVSTESIHELPPNTDGSIVYESGKSSADFVNGAQYYAQIQTFTDIAGTEGGSGLSVAKMFWCLVDPTLTITTIPSTISTTSYNVSATYTDTSASVVSNIIQQYQFSLYSATGSLLQSSGVVVGSGEQQGTSTTYDISYNFTGLDVGSSYYVTVEVTTTQGMSVSAQSSTFTVSIDTPTLGEATVVNNACDGYISVTSNLSSEYGGSGSGEIVSFDTDSENVFTKLQVDLEPLQDLHGYDAPWVGGAGKNLLPPLNTKQTFAENGLTVEFDTDGTIKITGTLNSGTSYFHEFTLDASVNVDASMYFHLLNPTGDNHTTIALRTSDSVTIKSGIPDTANKIIPIENSGTASKIAVFCNQTSAMNFTMRPMVCKTSTATAWTPYSNICPISGHDEVDVEHTGVNQWDEEWEVGSINASDGQNVSSENEIRSKNYIRVIPNETYYFHIGATSTSSAKPRWYDADKNYIGYTPTINYNATFTVPSNAYYLRFCPQATYGTTYNNDISINYPSTDHEYHAYTGQSYHQDIEVTYTPTVQDNTPYLFKQTGDVGGDRETIELVGGTVAWHQLVPIAGSSKTKTESNVTITDNRNGSYTVQTTQDGASADVNLTLTSATTSKGGHVGLLYGCPVGGYANGAVKYRLWDAWGGIGNDYGNGHIGKWVTGGQFEIRISVASGTVITTPIKFVPQLFDLTAMFGTTIADYIYSLEQATAGAGVAWFRNLFPKAYYPYNAGELISVKTSSHDTVGKNLSPIGSVSTRDNGAIYASQGHIYDEIVQGTTYTLSFDIIEPNTETATEANRLGVYINNVNPAIIRPALNAFGHQSVTFTAHSNGYINFWAGASEYAPNTKVIDNVQLEIGATETLYEPYTKSEYPLDSDLELRGMLKLDISNKLYYDGDTYKHDGSVNRKYGIVDLGTINWGYDANNVEFYASIDDIKVQPEIAGTKSSLVCVPYDTRDAGYASSYSTSDKVIWQRYNQTYILVRDSAYTTAQAFKTAMSGVYLVYEKATPTTETADEFEEIQRCYPYSTEEFIDSRTVPMPVGNNTQYLTRDVYGGYIDFVSGVLVLDRKCLNLGTIAWTKVTNSIKTYFQSTDEISDMAKSTGNNIIQPINCSHYMTETWTHTLDAVGYNGCICEGWKNRSYIAIYDEAYVSSTSNDFKSAMNGVQLIYPLAEPLTYQLTPQQIQTFVGKNNVWSEQGEISLAYHIPITNLLVKRQDVDDVSGDWLTLYSQPITQASDMDFTFIDFTNQYGKTYKYALVPLLNQTQSGVEVEVEGGYTVSDEVQSVFDGVFIVDSTGSQKCKANVGYGNVDMNQTVGTITPIGAKYPVVITNSKNQYHNGSISGTIVPDDYYFNGNLSRIDMVNKRDELEQFLTNKRAKIIKDWNGKIWLVMIMDNVSCTFNNNYGMGIVNFSTNWVEVGDPTNQQDLQATGLINVGGV